MSNLLVRDWLFKRGTAGLDQITEQYAVQVKRHNKHPNLVLLKYNQIESPMGDPMVQECRALILDEADYFRPVCYPYKKFFNHGESHAAELNWSTARCYEKLDGSLTTLYWYRDDWHVSTSGVPDAECPVGLGVGVTTFAKLFWRAWQDMGYQMPKRNDVVYMFELMCPENRVLIPHASRQLVLHGARDMVTLDELDPETVATANGWKCVRTFSLGSLSDILASAKELKPLEREGYVVCDGKFQRLKIKGPQYVALSHAKDGLSTRAMLELARKGEASEWLAYFPEMATEYEKVAERVQSLISAVEQAYAALRELPTQKDFAQAAVKHPFSSVLFALRAGKVTTVQEYLATCLQSHAERLIGLGGDA